MRHRKNSEKENDTKSKPENDRKKNKQENDTKKNKEENEIKNNNKSENNHKKFDIQTKKLIFNIIPGDSIQTDFRYCTFYNSSLLASLSASLRNQQIYFISSCYH